MWRDEPWRSRIAIAAMATGLGFCLWYLTTVPPASPALQEPRRTVPSSASGGSFETSAGTGLVESRRATTPSQDFASGVGSSHARPETVPASFAMSSTRLTAAVAELPSGLDDIAADGLPATALRCTQDGGLLNCGSCSTDGDCPQGQGCAPNRETRRLECMASECEEDAHCFPGFACRAVTTGATGIIVRRCVPEGIRREGETCTSEFSSRNSACREGLRCVSQVCTAPCQPDEPTSCPAGYECTESLDGPGCVPDCQKLGCPHGQQCKRLNTSKARCLARVSGTCPETPCAEGERCNMEVTRGRGAFWCARLCNPLRPDSCPTGYVCGRGGGGTSTCYRACAPMDLDSCGKGWMCSTVSEDLTLFGCTPAFAP